MTNQDWNKFSWQDFPAMQQPDWPDQKLYKETLNEIERFPPLVFAGEIRALRKKLKEVAEGKAFLLQGGDCAEEFSQCTSKTIRETLKVLLQMAVVLTYAGEKPVVKVGRIAGQYAKPRSKPTELVDGLELPSFRGDLVNAAEATLEARQPDARKLLQGYFHSASTLNLLRAFTRGGFASLEKVHSWNKEFVKNSKLGEKYEQMAEDIDKALTFMRVVGIDPEKTTQVSQVEFYTSHEALLLGYESALTRNDSLPGKYHAMPYDCSAHMLWIGDRTRQLDGAHVEFFRGIKNPIGIKVGPDHDMDVIRQLLDKLSADPDEEPGRITIITRFGADKIEKHLPGLIRGVEDSGHRVVWSCDPMHGNTYLSESNYKTRHFEAISSEIERFFQIHKAEGSVAGGVHLEMTGNNVTECIGGAEEIEDHHLEINYATSCDPRLNAKQSLELAFKIAGILKQG